MADGVMHKKWTDAKKGIDELVQMQKDCLGI